MLFETNNEVTCINKLFFVYQPFHLIKNQVILNQIIRLISQEDFISVSRRESFR
jgi:hypothetical protein